MRPSGRRRLPNHDMNPGLRARALRWSSAALWAAWLAGVALAQEGPARPAFNLDVRAPGPVQELLQRHLELQRYRQVPDLDDAELARLLRLADRDARELLG